MSSVDFDLDSAGGLMPKIQALIAPPESDETSKPGKKKDGLGLHPYYKRPGKGHNRDCCDACSEGGNLICCDKCPASFHLACHDPPLEDEDIPLGLWLCHKCRVYTGLPSLKEVLKKAKEKPSETADVTVKEESPSDTPTRGRSRTSSTASLESNKSRGRGRAALAAAASAAAAAYAREPITTASVAAGPDSHSALETLIAAASSMNPTQFDLPREMVLPINFPGTDRAPTRGKKVSAAKRSRTLELDNGLVPLPAKTCFECRKSCKKAPLLACDYCPLLFHLDCLDPPLTSLPCGRWMCPNHVEQAIDEKLLTSLSVTQRVALWDKYTGPIDQEVVKTEFLQKARRQNPPFRFKVKLAPRNRAKVPNAVKEMYKNRPPLVPTLRDVLRGNEISSRWADEKPIIYGQRLDGATENEQEEWLSGIVALQTSIACHLSSKRMKKSESSDNCENDLSTMKLKLDGCDKLGNKKRNFLASENYANLDTNVLTNGTSEDHEPCSVDQEDAEPVSNSKLSVNGAPISFNSRHSTSKIQNGELELSRIDCEPADAVDDLNERSSFEQEKEDNKGKAKRLCSLLENLKDDVDFSAPDFCIDKLDERLIRLLALQRLKQLAPDRGLLPDNFSMPVKDNIAKDQKETTVWPSPESGLKPRALLTPLNGSQPPMPIYYRVMEIGTGGDADICLSYYGHCNYVTAKHAVIICDEVNRHYELMNYSEHGTTVDNVLYSCDFSEKLSVKDPPLSPVPNPQHHGRRSGAGNPVTSGSTPIVAESTEAEVEVPPLIQKIRAVVDKRRGVIREEDVASDPVMMPADIGKVDMRCSCRSSSSSVIGGSGAGWEGTALLNHGSFIKFGCIQFTFSVLNFVSAPFKEAMSQESATAVNQREEKGVIPQRILKRERDSTSSSTLTVSPSPPPDKLTQMIGARRAERLRKARENNNDDDDDDDDNDDEEDEEEEEDDREEINDLSDQDGDEADDIMDEDRIEDIGKDVEMRESPVEIKQEYDQFLLEEDCIISSNDHDAST